MVWEFLESMGPVAGFFMKGPEYLRCVTCKMDGQGFLNSASTVMSSAGFWG